MCDEIAQSIALGLDETCIEIGGGKGALTKKLIGRCRRMIVYEIDPNWAAHLREFGPTWGNPPGGFEVRETDALLIGWSRASLGLAPNEPLVIAGNLPYYITSPLFLRLAYSRLNFNRAIFLIQKEVAERIAAKPGATEYGRLSVSLGAFLETSMLFDVGPEAFNPPPKVNSTLIKMVPRPEPIVTPELTPKFERTVQASFQMRRKTLKNNLKASFPNLGEERIDAILESLGIAPKARAQEIGLNEFVSLTRLLE